MVPALEERQAIGHAHLARRRLRRSVALGDASAALGDTLHCTLDNLQTVPLRVVFAPPCQTRKTCAEVARTPPSLGEEDAHVGLGALGCEAVEHGELVRVGDVVARALEELQDDFRMGLADDPAVVVEAARRLEEAAVRGVGRRACACRDGARTDRLLGGYDGALGFAKQSPVCLVVLGIVARLVVGTGRRRLTSACGGAASSDATKAPSSCVASRSMLDAGDIGGAANLALARPSRRVRAARVATRLKPVSMPVDRHET